MLLLQHNYMVLDGLQLSPAQGEERRGSSSWDFLLAGGSFSCRLGFPPLPFICLGDGCIDSSFTHWILFGKKKINKLCNKIE